MRALPTYIPSLYTPLNPHEAKTKKKKVTRVGLEPTLGFPNQDAMLRCKALTWRHNQLGHLALVISTPSSPPTLIYSFIHSNKKEPAFASHLLFSTLLYTNL